MQNTCLCTNKHIILKLDIIIFSEIEKMGCTCVDAVLEHISCLWQSDVGKWDPARVGVIDCDLRFIKMFLSCLVSWDSAPYLRSISASIENLWEINESFLEMSFGESPTNWDLQILEENIHYSKTIIKKHSERLMLKSLKCKALTSQEVHQFLHIILINTDYLLSCRAERGLLVVKNQMETIKEKLLIFMNLVQFVDAQCLNCKAVDDFNIHVLTWSNKAACLMFLYYVEYFVTDKDFQNGRRILVHDHEFENTANFMVTDLLQKANPCTPEFIEMCFAIITLIKFSCSDVLRFVEFVSSFIDLLLKDLMFISKDDFEKLREGLIYLFAYLAGPLATSANDSKLILIRNQIDAVLSKASHLICLSGDQAKVDSEDVLVELLSMIEQVRGNFDTQHLLQIPHSSYECSNFPRTNGLGFVESLLLYLQDLEQEMNNTPKLLCSLKQQIFTIKEELASLKLFLQDISHLPNEQKELKVIWEEIIVVAHQAELAIKQSFFINHPLCLSHILLKIQDIKHEVMRLKGNNIYSTGARDIQGNEASSIMSSSNVVNTSGSTFVADGVVGFEEEVNELVDRLTRGTKNLGIVSIVGMGGIGKTTLAMKVFNQKSVMYHFHVRASCSVSQVYRRKEMLLGMLSCLIDGELRSMTEEDLAERLYKGLKERRYLIVLDDIWNISAWNDVKMSFPDDGNGSRVVFTTRISNVPMLANLSCTTHKLRFLTLDESWDLLQQKIFHKDSCPPDLIEVGRLIAKNCKGLPLSVVLVGGLLGKTERSMSWWQEIADDLTSFISGEGCANVIELSYKHLSEVLKSCLLYLGAFPEDTKFRAGDVTKLWAAEGFIPMLDRSCVDKVAKEFLNCLGDRSMIIVDERSLYGKIKYFRLHDLIRDFCITKAKEEQFLIMVNGRNINSSVPLIYDGHRMSVQSEWRCFLDANPRGPIMRSLLCFDDNDDQGIDAYFLHSLFRNFKLVQVLHLPFVRISDIPTELIILIHLTYLRVTCDFDISSGVLPTINLRNLETLRIRGSANLADKIWKMRRLRHVKVSGHCLVALDDATSQLPDLETFGRVKILEGEKGEELLRRLPNLRKLRCRCYPSTKLDFLTKLESLYIEYTHQPNYLSAFSFPSTLRKLTLEGFQLSGTELSTMIGKLPCLQILKLKWCRFYGNRWDLDDYEFPHLKFLELYESDIECWSATIDSFCSLEKLVLSYCRQLVEIPPCFGEVVTLRILEVTDCNEQVENSAIQIQIDQLDLGNDTLQFVTFANHEQKGHFESDTTTDDSETHSETDSDSQV